MGLVALLLWAWSLQTAERSTASLAPVTVDGGLTTEPWISEDGKTLSYVSDRGTNGPLELWRQDLGHEAAPVRLTNDGADKKEPSMSPDGSAIVFRSTRNGGGLYVIPATGGTPTLVASSGRTGRFAPDG